MSKSIALLAALLLLCSTLSAALPLRSLFLRSYGDMNPESVSRGYFRPDVNLNDEETNDGSDNRAKRGLDLLKRRVEIIERNRCFFNPITCY